MKSKFLLVACAVGCGYPEPAALIDAGAEVPPDVLDPAAAPRLFAARPEVANTGDVVSLDGDFGSAATVTFPGGATVPATIVGPHRAAVVVPAAATAGDLFVTTGGATTAPVPFRRASFGLGLQPFQRFDDHTNGARQMPQLAVPRWLHATVTIGRSVYVIGGHTGSAQLASVERAPMNADGSLGAFTTVPGVSLTAPRAEHQAVVVGKYVYVLGGFTGATGPAATLERAEIASDGTLGTFAPADITLAIGVTGMRPVLVGDGVYVIGGRTSQDDFPTGDAVTTVQRAPIRADGTLGPFAVDASQLGVARENHAVAVVGDRVYAIGGAGVAGRTAPLSSIEVATIGADGRLGAFAAAQRDLATARMFHHAFAIGTSLYVAGGFSGGSNITSIEVASLAGGALGAFGAAPPLPDGRLMATYALVENYVYAIGGSSSGIGANVLGTVARASINATGQLAASAAPTRPYADGNTMLDARFPMPAAVLGDRIHLLGSGATNSVEQGAIDAAGALGALTVAPSTIPGCKSRLAAATIRNAVFLVGGAPCQNQALDQIHRAPVNADRSLGAFALQAGKLVTPRASTQVVVLGNNLYAIGGWYVGETTVERAPINGDGSLGTFATLPVTTTVPRMDFSVAVIGNFLYLIGGANTSESAAIRTIERIAINADGSLSGSFTQVGSLVTPRFFPGVSVIGGFVYVFGGEGYASGTSVERAAINADGSLGAFATVTGLTAPGISPVVVTRNAVHACDATKCGSLELR